MLQVMNGVPVLDGVSDQRVLVAELLETDDSVLSLALSRDGKKLAAGGCDRLIRVWDLSGSPAAAKLEHTIENLSTSSENLTASESRIRDADMAQEMVGFTRSNILQQAGTSILAQANNLPQSILSLLR